MTPELKALTQRLEEVEKQIAHLAALTVEQSDTDRTVVARQFIVKDVQGTSRAVLGMAIPKGDTEESPWLGLLDANGNVRTCLSVGAEGAAFEIYNAKGQAIGEVREFQDGPRIALFDSEGNTRACLKVKEDGLSESGSFAYLFSPDGKQGLRMELFSSGQASLVMSGVSGDSRLILAVDSDEPGLAFIKDDKAFWTVP